MTGEAVGTQATGRGAGVSRLVDIEGVPMSALVLEAARPRAVVVALHGGGATSAYFDAPNRPRLSLLRTGALLGFTVIALDRPGYGRSAAYADELTSPVRRVDLVCSAVDRLLASRSRGGGVFVMAHSRGCELALRWAAGERGTDLLGLELAATGLRHHPRALEVRTARLRARRSPAAGGKPAGRAAGRAAGTAGTAGTGLRDILWGPARLYPADIDGGAEINAPLPAYEVAEAQHWERDLPELAARVSIPVRLTLGDHERWWESGLPALAGLAALFTTSSRVAVNEQWEAGHNLSLGLSAMAYHLKVLAFAGECLPDREHPG